MPFYVNSQLADVDLTALGELSGTGVVVRTGAGTATTRSVAGTADRITVTNGSGVSGNPTVDIASTYVGQATITTLGTIATGVWTGTTIAVANGGTGLTGGTSGGILGYTAAGTLASSVVLTANAIVIGGGAGATPTPLALGTANQVVGMNSGGTAHEYKSFAVGTTGTDFAVAHSANTITFNLPDASATARGAVTTGTQTFAGAKTFSGAVAFSSTVTVTSTNASAFAVGANGATNPVLQVDASAASVATGVKLTGAAAAGGAAIAAISSGTDETLTINAKGAGVVALAGVSTGGVGIGGSDVLLFRDAANVIAFRNSTTVQTVRIYGTYTDGSNYERLTVTPTAGSLFTIAAETAGTGADNLSIHIQCAGTGAVSLRTSGVQYLVAAGGASDGVWNIAGVGGHLTPGTTNTYDVGSTSLLVRSAYVATSVVLGSGCTLVQGGTAAGTATSATRLIVKKTGIADNTPTDVITVTVPNANHAACIKLRILSSNGSTDAFESSRCAEGMVVLARTTGVATVAAVATLEMAQIATVGGGATHTLAYGVSAMTGAAGATQTFTIQLTIDDSGNTGSNQAVILAEVINAESSGVTIAAV